MRTLSIDDDVFEMITALKQEGEDKKDAVRRIINKYNDCMKAEDETESIADKKLVEYRAPLLIENAEALGGGAEHDGILKVTAYALNETEQKEVRNQLINLSFRLTVIESDLILAELIVTNEADAMKTISTLEESGWKW